MTECTRNTNSDTCEKNDQCKWNTRLNSCYSFLTGFNNTNNGVKNNNTQCSIVTNKKLCNNSSGCTWTNNLCKSTRV